MSELSAGRDNGLWAAAQHQLGEDPKNGAMLCFTNRERTRLKLLYWDGYATAANMGRCSGRKEWRRAEPCSDVDFERPIFLPDGRTAIGDVIYYT